MSGKPRKSPQPSSKKPGKNAGSGRTAADAATSNKNALRPVREGPANLKQRAAWFQRRTGGKKS